MKLINRIDEHTSNTAVVAIISTISFNISSGKTQENKSLLASLLTTHGKTFFQSVSPVFILFTEHLQSSKGVSESQETGHSSRLNAPSTAHI